MMLFEDFSRPSILILHLCRILHRTVESHSRAIHICIRHMIKHRTGFLFMNSQNLSLVSLPKSNYIETEPLAYLKLVNNTVSIMQKTMSVQACVSGLASRLRLEDTSMFASMTPIQRKTTRSANGVNYAELEDGDFEDDAEDSVKESQLEVAKKKTQSEVKKLAVKTRHVYYTPQQLEELANQEEILVPIRIHLEYDNYRITDFVMWNAKETGLTPDLFASITCSELDLPIGYTSQITSLIKQQLAEYTELASVKLPTESGLHVILNLSMNLDNQVYEDKIEWDLSDNTMTAEQFSRVIVADLGLSGDFYPAIAHCMHEAILRMKREIIEGRLPAEIDNQAAFSADAGWRVDQELLGEEWAPTVEVMSQEEIERLEIERNREMRNEIRRMKRDTASYQAQKRRRVRLYDDTRDSRGTSPLW